MAPSPGHKGGQPICSCIFMVRNQSHPYGPIWRGGMRSSRHWAIKWQSGLFSQAYRHLVHSQQSAYELMTSVTKSPAPPHCLYFLNLLGECSWNQVKSCWSVEGHLRGTGVWNHHPLHSIMDREKEHRLRKKKKINKFNCLFPWNSNSFIKLWFLLKEKTKPNPAAILGRRSLNERPMKADLGGQEDYRRAFQIHLLK